MCCRYFISLISRANNVTTITKLLTRCRVDVGGVNVMGGQRFRRNILRLTFPSGRALAHTGHLLASGNCVIRRQWGVGNFPVGGANSKWFPRPMFLFTRNVRCFGVIFGHLPTTKEVFGRGAIYRGSQGYGDRHGPIVLRHFCFASVQFSQVGRGAILVRLLTYSSRYLRVNGGHNGAIAFLVASVSSSNGLRNFANGAHGYHRYRYLV